jgi:sacsin
LIAEVGTIDELHADDIPILGEDCKLHARGKIFFNDLAGGIRESIPEAIMCTHRLITADLAKGLNLILLSESGLADLGELEEVEMQEDLSYRISGTPRQYSRDQIFLEFLANAVDAGASTMTVIVDKKVRPKKPSSLLFLPSSAFRTHPALVFHNDSVFTEQDFIGIRQIGIGSKRTSDGKIGRFGLGALSAYHISVVVVVVVVFKYGALGDSPNRRLTNQ